MAGFISPNHTQTPNDLFDEHMRHMTEAELKIVLTVVRNTLGWHRASHPVSLTVFEKMTGLSRQACLDGVNAAIEHGFILADRTPGKTTTYTLNVSDSHPASQDSRPVKGLEESTELTGTGQDSRPVGSQDSRLSKEIEEKQTSPKKKRGKRKAASEIETQESVSIPEESSTQTQSSETPPAEEAEVPPAVLHGLGMPGAANVAKLERQAKDYRKVLKNPLYLAFAQAWADSLTGKTAAEREALIPQLRPDNAARHLDTIGLLELMNATPDHVRTIVLAKREKGRSEYPFAWLPDDVQKLIVAEADTRVDPETGYTSINMEPEEVNVPGAAPDDHKPWKPHVITDQERQQFASVLGPKPELPGAAYSRRERA